MKLDIAEQQAINEFIQSNWAAFQKVALEFMSEEEIEVLGDKLAKQD